MSNQKTSSRPSLPPSITVEDKSQTLESDQSRWTKIGLVAGAVLVAALLIGGLIFLLQPGTDTGRVRDIFIIFMALEFLIIGLALIILIIQLARLINLLQHEIKPILDSTSDAAHTLRGTTEFISDHLVEPIMRLNQYLAGLSKFFNIFRSKDTSD